MRETNHIPRKCPFSKTTYSPSSREMPPGMTPPGGEVLYARYHGTNRNNNTRRTRKAGTVSNLVCPKAQLRQVKRLQAIPETLNRHGTSHADIRNSRTGFLCRTKPQSTRRRRKCVKIETLPCHSRNILTRPVSILWPNFVS